MPLRIVKPHAREHKTRRFRQSTNLYDVLTFVNRASRHELYAIRIAMQDRPSWIRGKEVTSGK